MIKDSLFDITYFANKKPVLFSLGKDVVIRFTVYGKPLNKEGDISKVEEVLLPYFKIKTIYPLFEESENFDKDLVVTILSVLFEKRLNDTYIFKKVRKIDSGLEIVYENIYKVTIDNISVAIIS